MDDNAQRTSSEFVSLISDLTFSAKVRGAAATLQRTHANFRRFDALIGETGSHTKGLVVDLSHPEAAMALEWVSRRSEGVLPVLAFYPHIERERGDFARAFEFVQVTTRSKFELALIEFLSKARGG